MAGFTFGTPIVGTSGKFKKGPFTVAVAEASYFNVSGASVIVGELGPRDIECEHWLWSGTLPGYTSRAQVDAAYTVVKKAIGKTKTLSNAIGESFPNCLLESITEMEGPVFSPPLGWMYVLAFKWRQLEL